MDDYVPWARPSPLLDALGGFRSHPTDPLRHGFTVTGPKANARGLLHAGAIAAVADVAIGHRVARLRSEAEPVPLVTVNLACDLLGSATLDDWVDLVVEPVRLGRRLGSGTADLTVDGRPLAHVTALFVPV